MIFSIKCAIVSFVLFSGVPGVYYVLCGSVGGLRWRVHILCPLYRFRVPAKLQERAA